MGKFIVILSGPANDINIGLNDIGFSNEVINNFMYEENGVNKVKLEFDEFDAFRKFIKFFHRKPFTIETDCDFEIPSIPNIKGFSDEISTKFNEESFKDNIEKINALVFWQNTENKYLCKDHNHGILFPAINPETDLVTLACPICYYTNNRIDYKEIMEKYKLFKNG